MSKFVCIHGHHSIAWFIFVQILVYFRFFFLQFMSNIQHFIFSTQIMSIVLLSFISLQISLKQFRLEFIFVPPCFDLLEFMDDSIFCSHMVPLGVIHGFCSTCENDDFLLFFFRCNDDWFAIIG